MFTTTNLAPTSPDLSPAPPRNFATSAAAAANANLKIVVGLSSFGHSSAAGTRSDNSSDEHEQYRRPTSLVGNMDSSKKKTEGLVRVVSHIVV